MCPQAQQTPVSDEDLAKFIFEKIIPKAFPKTDAIWFPSWSGPKTIPVCWEGNYPERERDLVREAVKRAWEDNSQLQFTGWQQCVPNNKGIRIVVEDVAPDQGPHTKGLGNAIDGEKNGMSLNFTFQNWGSACSRTRDMCIKAIAIHEFGHALGFAHEQNRDDTPDWCKLDPLRGPQGESGTNQDVTPWDPKSVMNYCWNMYTEDVKLSKYDLMALKKYYGP